MQYIQGNTTPGTNFAARPGFLLLEGFEIFGWPCSRFFGDCFVGTSWGKKIRWQGKCLFHGLMSSTFKLKEYKGYSLKKK